MLINPISFVKAAIGDEGFEELRKGQIYRSSTNTAILEEELDAALRIVPRTLLAFLVYHLKPMSAGEEKVLEIPGNPECYVRLNKVDTDIYMGEFIKNGQMVHRFKNATIPNIGTHLVTYFEMYDTILEGSEPEKKDQEPLNVKIQRIVEEKIALRDMVSRVVDKKLEEREAIQQMVLNRIASSMTTPQAEKPEVIIEIKEDSEDGGLDLDKKEDKVELEPHKKQLQNMREKLAKINKEKNISKTENNFVSVMMADESTHCPGCRKKIFTKSE